MHMHVTVLLFFVPNCPHQWVGEWHSDKTTEERWGRRMKDAIQHKCYCNLNLFPALEFSPFPVAGSVSRLLMMEETAGRVEFKVKLPPSLFLCHHVRATTHFWNAKPTTKNEHTIGLPLGWCTYTRNNLNESQSLRWQQSHWNQHFICYKALNCSNLSDNN